VERSTKYNRRVYLDGRTTPDGGKARGLDEILGTNLFGASGRSGASGLRAGFRLGQISDREVVGSPDDDLITELGAELDRAQDEGLTIAIPDSGLLAYVMVGLQDRSLSPAQAAEKLGMSSDSLSWWLGRVAKLAAQVRHSSKRPIRPAGQEVLFGLDAQVPAIEAGWLPFSVAQAVEGFDLTRLCRVTCARMRAEQAQCHSDPDLARLLRLQDLLVTAHQRYRAGLDDCIEELTSSAALAAVAGDAELARYNYDAIEPGAARNDIGTSRWGPGLLETWAILRHEERIIAAAARILREATTGKRSLKIGEVIGLIGLWSPTGARKVWVSHCHSLCDELSDVDFRGIPAPPTAFATWKTETVIGLVRRRGWLEADPEEPTFRERACRPFTLGVATEEGRKVVDTAVANWADKADPTGLIDLMDSTKADAQRTRYVLQVKPHERDVGVPAVTELSRQAWAWISGKEPPVRSSLGARLFWRFPRRIVDDATELSRPI
jgi:hypothetical protein